MEKGSLQKTNLLLSKESGKHFSREQILRLLSTTRERKKGRSLKRTSPTTQKERGS